MTDQRTEHGEQCAFIQWCGDSRGRWPALEYIYATPNGGKRDAVVAMKLRQEGVKPGVSDIFLPVPIFSKYDNCLYYGLWLEMKRPVGGKLSQAQLEWLIAMHKYGFATCVAEGYLPASHYTEVYMDYLWNEESAFKHILAFPVEKARS